VTGRADGLIAEARSAVLDLAIYCAIAFALAVALAFFSASHFTRGVMRLSHQADASRAASCGTSSPSSPTTSSASSPAPSAR
jgi:hypothetical protein